MLRLIVTGVGGRMGGTILRLAVADPDFEVAHALEAKGHPLVGKGIDVLTGTTSSVLTVEDDFSTAVGDGDVVIDFTEPVSSLNHFLIASDHGKGIVIGTTGMPERALAEIRQTKDAKAVISPNMSVGVNLMFALVERASRVLGRDYDTEIIEMHHRWKKDAPSGTAVRLRNIVEASNATRQWIRVPGRDGMWGERKPEEIGLFAVRGGDIVGEHTVLFAGLGERLEVTHRAYSRDNFARGALLAARWLATQKAGIYDMRDVLGL